MIFFGEITKWMASNHDRLLHPVLLLRLIECLEHVVLFIGLSGQKLAIQTCLLVEVRDVLHFLKIKASDFFQKQGKRISYYSMRIMIGALAEKFSPFSG